MSQVTDEGKEREALLEKLRRNLVSDAEPGSIAWGAALRDIRAHDARIVEAAMEAKAREVEEKLEAETRVGRTWVAAFLRNFRAPKGEKL